MQIPFAGKLSKAEQKYLDTLSTSFDDQLIATGKWFASAEAKEWFRNNRNELRSFFTQSGIRDELEPIIERSVADSDAYLEQFYKTGLSLGYKDLHTKLVFTEMDKEALYHLKNYNFDLIRDLNKELQTGIKTVITESVLEGHGYQETASRLLELPLEPIKSNVSLRQRAEMIARTEHARAVNTGTIQAYTNMGVTEVEIINGADPCDDCIELANNSPYPLKEGMDLLVAHPNCTCAYAPVVDSIDHKADPVIADLTNDNKSGL